METTRHDPIDFFLGATTPAGFKGYFEPLRREPGMQMYLIKSGPGCGKSTLMKRLARTAEQNGLLTQRIHCASDPDSLDGVILPGQHRAIVDATAPHVVEPDAPGADEVVVSLYHTIDAEKLHLHTSCAAGRRGISLRRAVCFWTAAGPRHAVPILTRCAATSSVCAPGCCRAPRAPAPRSCGCSMWP